MGQGISPLKLVFWLVFLLVAAGCGSGTESTVESPLPMELVVDKGGVSVNGTDVPVGEPTAIAFGQPIMLDEQGSGLLSVGDFEFELFKGSDLEVHSADRLELRAFLKSGHLRVKSDQETEVRLQLSTPNATITTLTRSFEFTVCQAPTGQTCARVESGEVDWLSGGKNVTLHRGQSEFAELGAAPGSPACLAEADYIAWFDAARRNEPGPALGELVLGAPSCGVEEEGGDDHGEGGVDEEGGMDEYTGSKIPTSVGMELVSVEAPVIGTDQFATNPKVYREPTSLDGPIRFYINQRLVSNEDYRAWLVSEAGVDPDRWSELAPDAWLRDAPNGDPTQATFPTGGAEAPVLGVQSAAAARFCTFTDKSLATEIKWELAAGQGVLEDLGSAREWVAEWDEYGRGVPPGVQVVRGRNDLFEPDLYYRWVQADQAEQPVASADVGFRCTADEVRELVTAAPQTAEVVYNDEFCDFDNGWPAIPGDGFDIGYHPQCFYHVESSNQHTEVAVMSGSSVTQLNSVEADVSILKVGPERGNFRYGLLVGSPESGYLLFTVQPEPEGERYFLRWCVQGPSDPIITGLQSSLYTSPAPADDGDANRHRGEACKDGAATDRVEVAGTENNTIRISAADAGSVIVAIDGTDVGEAPVPMPSGDFGFFVQTYHKDLAHIHYGRLTATGS